MIIFHTRAQTPVYKTRFQRDWHALSFPWEADMMSTMRDSKNKEVGINDTTIYQIICKESHQIIEQIQNIINNKGNLNINGGIYP